MRLLLARAPASDYSMHECKCTHVLAQLRALPLYRMLQRATIINARQTVRTCLCMVVRMQRMVLPIDADV